MTGFGQSGPLAQAAGHDLNYIALTGALHAIGPAGAKPVPPLNLVGDYGGGALYLAMGLLAALHERTSSGKGQVVDAAMVDGAASLMSIFYGMHASGRWSEQRGDNLLDGGAPFYDTYETADGKYVSIGALEPKFFAEMAQRIGLDPSFIKRQYDRKTWPEMRAAMSRDPAQQDARRMERPARRQRCVFRAGADDRGGAAPCARPRARGLRRCGRRAATRPGAAFRPQRQPRAATCPGHRHAHRRAAGRGRLPRRRDRGAARGRRGSAAMIAPGRTQAVIPECAMQRSTR